NIALNRCSNVEAHNVAVSDSPGVARYKRDANSPSPELRIQPDMGPEASANEVVVNAIALDHFFQTKGIVPDVIKIDVEGAEMHVLSGMRHTLRELRPILFLEIHPANLPHYHTSPSAILSLLIDNHYEVFEIEHMRSQKATGRLRPLTEHSTIERNTMLY